MSKNQNQPNNEDATPQENLDAAENFQEPNDSMEQESLEVQRDDLLARLQRLSADFLNYQKRTQRDIQQAHEFANETLIKQLLGVLDDMERALEAAKANHDADDPLMTGMVMVHDNLLKVLGRFGLERIDATGKPFNPEEHAAMMQQLSDEHPPQTVLSEIQRGYRLKGRTIRPTSVIVSKEPEEGASS